MSTPTLAKKGWTTVSIFRGTTDEQTVLVLERFVQWLRLLTFFMAMVGFATGIAASEYLCAVLYDTEMELEVEAAQKMIDTASLLKYVTTISTIILLALIMVRYYIEYELKVLRGLLLGAIEGFRDSGLLRPMLLELILCAIHCPAGVFYNFQAPNLGVQITYNLDAALSIVLCLRLYLIVGLVDDAFGFRSTHARVVARSMGLRFNTFFTFKSSMASAPIFTVSSMFSITVIICAYFMRVTERPVCNTPEAMTAGWCGPQTMGTKDYSQYSVAVWAVLITALTVGYGDIFPITHAGRVVMIVVAIFGVVFVALLVNAVGKTIQLASDEEGAIKALRKQVLRVERRGQAAALVIAFLHYTVYMHRVKKAARSGSSLTSRLSMASGYTVKSPFTNGAFGSTPGATTTPNPLRRGATAVGAFEENLRQGTGAAHRMAPAEIALSFVTDAWRVLPMPIVRQLVRALHKWRLHGIEWMDFHRSRDHIDTVKRDLEDMRSMIGALSTKAEGDAAEPDGRLGGPGSASIHARQRAVEGQLSALGAVLTTAVTQLNALCTNSGSGDAVQPVPVWGTLIAQAEAASGVRSASQLSMQSGFDGGTSSSIGSPKAVARVLGAGQAMPGGNVHMGANQMYKGQYLHTLLGLNRAKGILQAAKAFRGE